MSNLISVSSWLETQYIDDNYAKKWEEITTTTTQYSMNTTLKNKRIKYLFLVNVSQVSLENHQPTVVVHLTCRTADFWAALNVTLNTVPVKSKSPKIAFSPPQQNSPTTAGFVWLPCKHNGIAESRTVFAWRSHFIISLPSVWLLRPNILLSSVRFTGELWKVHLVTQGASRPRQTTVVFFQLSTAPVHYSFGKP